MSQNVQHFEAQENQEQAFASGSDIYEPELGEIVQPTPISAVSTQQSSTQHTQSNTQPTVADVPPDVFIGHAARRLRLESLVSDFRDGKRTKEETLTAVHSVLNRGPPLSNEEKETTLRLCTEEINATEERERRGLAITTEPSAPGATVPQNAGPTHATKQARNHSRTFGPEHSDHGSEPESDAGEPRKRLRLQESDMPWYERETLDEPSINPSCIKTVQSLRLFNRDIKACKFYVSVATGASDNIPPAQWEHIFKGEPIDLDQILSSLHRITTTSERKASFGDTDIILGPVEATRKVTTSSDWSTAWRRAARAISFVFPHRTRELDEYAEYIESEFAAKIATGHHRIILFDVAVRNLVRGGQQILLTDSYRFGPLYSAIVMPDGVQYTSGGHQHSSGGRKAQTVRNKTATCNRFNDKGCNSTNCRYRHACGACGSTNHGKGACGAASKN
jgi:hypothetical protein